MNILEDVFNEPRTIKQFKKAGNQLVHPFSARKSNESSKTIDVYLYTLGHLWIYMIFEQIGYGAYLREIIEYSIKKKNAIFEWEIYGDIENDITTILKKYNLKYAKYLSEDFILSDFADIDKKSKDKEQPLMRLTKLLIMAELEIAEQIYDSKKELEILLDKEGAIINSTYLFVAMTGGEDKIFSKVPETFKDIIIKNMNCYHDDYEMRYYPKLNELMGILDSYEQVFEKEWYLIDDNAQVIISKFLYSVC